MAEKFDALNKSWKVITDILSPEKQPLPGTVRYSHFLPFNECMNVDAFGQCPLLAPSVHDHQMV